jgi:hypothetical protein
MFERLMQACFATWVMFVLAGTSSSSLAQTIPVIHQPTPTRRCHIPTSI